METWKSPSVLLMLLLILLLLHSTTIQTANGVTFVEGNITVDTTWTLANSPYRAINDVIVDSGVLLTIEPGVEIQFADGFSLNIEGSLYAVGTDANQILFTSSRSSPSPGVWDTIRFKGNSSEQFTLEHVTVEYATHAVTTESLGIANIEDSHLSKCAESGIDVIGKNHVFIENNIIIETKNGITGKGSVASSNILSGISASNNIISNSLEDGVYLANADKIQEIILSSNTILSSGGNGIYGGASSEISSVILNSNNVSLNIESGVYINCDGGSPIISDVIISGNTVVQNNRHGVHLRSSASGSGMTAYINNVVLSSNIASLNGEKGIYFEISPGGEWFYLNNADISNISIASNTVTSNSEMGIHIQSSARQHAFIKNISFASNMIYSNGDYGVYLRSFSELTDPTYINNVTFSDNTISLNDRDGANLDSLYYMYDIVFTSNVISSNGENGMCTKASYHNEELVFDILISDNAISANNLNGVWIAGGINANMTRNAISYSGSDGVLFETTLNNHASYNNINFNTNFEMRVINGATVKAENNYWGHSTGPYHASLNPEGEGKPVNGDGTDLDFIPFLTSPVEGIIPELPAGLLMALILMSMFAGAVLIRKTFLRRD